MDETNDNGYQCLRIKVINRDHFNMESYKEIMMNADNLYESALLAIKSSKDKYQTKKFSRHIFEHISLAQKELLNQTWEIENVKPFLISERGHKRKIQGNTPHDRMIMNCFCNKILIPALEPYLIYDNYASREGKGTSQRRERFEYFLHRAFREYGSNDFLVLLLDLSKFYDNMQHRVIKSKIMPKLNDDAYCGYILDTILKSFEVNVSFMTDEQYATCLDDKYISLEHIDDQIDIATPKWMAKSVNIGALPSQTISTFFLTDNIDNYFKTVKGIKPYGRYQDDIFIIDNRKDFLNECLNDFRKKCHEDKLFPNDKKSQIHPVSKPFKFLNRIYRMTETGHLEIHLSQDTVYREKRKLKKLHGLYISGEKEFSLIENQYKSWREQFRKYMTHSQLQTLDSTYNSLFIESFVRGEDYE